MEKERIDKKKGMRLKAKQKVNILYQLQICECSNINTLNQIEQQKGKRDKMA